MTKRKTTEEFKLEVYSLVENEYSVLSEYDSSHEHLTIKHNICNNAYPVSPSNFLKGKRCPYCYGNKKKTTASFKNEVFSLVGNDYDVLGEYFNINTHILMKHMGCGNEYLVTPDKFLRGRRCPKCMDRQRIITHTKTTDRFKEEVRKLVNEEYSVLGEYTYALKYLKMRHESCGHEYKVTPANFLNGKRCPKCSKSHGERKMRDTLESMGISYESNKTFKGLTGTGGGRLSYDFYIDEIKLLIEFQGVQHERPVDFLGKGEENAINKFVIQQEHDRRKREYAKNNNLNLLEIWYWDSENIPSIVEKEVQKLKVDLGKE